MSGIITLPSFLCPIQRNRVLEVSEQAHHPFVSVQSSLVEDLSCFIRNLGSRAANALVVDSGKSEAGLNPAVWPGAQHMVLEKRYLLWIVLTPQFHLSPMRGMM